MDIQTLAPSKGSRTKEKRIGRGIGSGTGKTSTKGHKGQWARSGGGVRPGFEGGQMPLTRRLPKRGFTNKFKKVYTIVSISDLERFDDGTVVNADMLLEAGVIRKIEKDGLKILANGNLSKKLTVTTDKISNTAKDMIEKVGGTVVAEGSND